MYINESIKNTHRVKDHEKRDTYLRLDMNENPDGLPASFVEDVLKKVTPSFLASYPRKDDLIQLIARREHLKEENITLTNGSDEGIRLVFEAFTKPGSTLVTVLPTFEMYQVYAKMFGLRHEKIPFQDDFSIRVDSLLKAIRPGVSLVVLLNPNSPIGTEFSEEEFRRIIMAAEEAGATVLIDEAYYPFGTGTKMDYVNSYNHILVLRTFSKLCSLAALRIGYLAGAEETIHIIDNAQSTYNVNSAGILFAEELLKREDILEDLKRVVDSGRTYLVRKLSEGGYEYFAEGGNYVLLRPHTSSKDVMEKLKERGILVKGYRSGILQDWIRITLGSEGLLERFWKEFSRIDS